MRFLIIRRLTVEMMARCRASQIVNKREDRIVRVSWSSSYLSGRIEGDVRVGCRCSGS